MSTVVTSPNWLAALRRPLADAVSGCSYISLVDAAAHFGGDLRRLPVTLRILLENLLRHYDGDSVTCEDIASLIAWPARPAGTHQIAFHPDRLIVPDSSGLPLLADLAALRQAACQRGLDPAAVELRLPVHLIVDHSVAADVTGLDAVRRNQAIEMQRNAERYRFLRWAEGAFRNLLVVPPGRGIIHQVNLELLAKVVEATPTAAGTLLHAETLVGADSHTPMINGLGILGFGIGGIEAGACMLGDPVSLAVPEVFGCRLTGRLPPGTGGSDLALALTAALRRRGIGGAIVEFFGPGLDALTAADRATVANMAPEYGAMMGHFPIDKATLAFLTATGRTAAAVATVETYARAQHLWRDDDVVPAFSHVLEFDLSQVEPSLAGPSRPDQRLGLSQVPASFAAVAASRPIAGPSSPLRDGDVVIAAITSCTSTANPAAMVTAGLLARNAARAGLHVPPWVKATLSPGSRMVTDYLQAFGLLPALAAVGFDLVGYGCMTCVGAAGPLSDGVEAAIAASGATVAAVLSGNRNFPGRVHPLVPAGYLAAPALVVAYGLAGTVNRDLAVAPLGSDAAGQPVMLAELWPDAAEVDALAAQALTASRCRAAYDALADGDDGWADLAAPGGPVFPFDSGSSYLKRPPFCEPDAPAWSPAADIRGARALLVLGDDVSTDHISPAGRIEPLSPAGRHLAAHGVAPAELGSYLARRVNHEVMVRGTFASPRLANALAGGAAGGITRIQPTGDLVTVHEAALHYRRRGTPMLIIAGQRYGCGSSRDWAAKGTRLLGVRAVIAESFERIHRANLIGMGVLPLQFPPHGGRQSLAIEGTERFDLTGLANALLPGGTVLLRICRADGRVDTVSLVSRVETRREGERLAAGGILPHLLHRLGGPLAA